MKTDRSGNVKPSSKTETAYKISCPIFDCTLFSIDRFAILGNLFLTSFTVVWMRAGGRACVSCVSCHRSLVTARRGADQS